MSQAEDERAAVAVSRLLAGAAKTIANVRYCWLATAAKTGGANARPMGLLPRDPHENDWRIRFITDGRSQKVSDIRHASTVAVMFQHDADDAYVTLIGTATLRERASEVRQRWKETYGAYFRSEQDRANAIFIEVDVERMELWIRGVTPETFGLHTTTLERDAGTWRLMPNDR